MSKREKTFVILYVVMLLIFFVSRWLNIGNYDRYDGKISHITGTSVPDFNNKYGSGVNSYPYIEYYKDNDTLNLTHKGWSSMLLSENEKITVLINRGDESDVMLLSFFNYWLPVYSIVIFLFIGFIGYGAVVTFDQNDYVKSQRAKQELNN